MEVAVGTGLFILAMVLCLVTGLPILYAMTAGLVIFLVLGRRMGYRFGTLGRMCLRKCSQALIVWRVFFYIGMMTGLWRSSGTIAFVIVKGIQLIPPSVFVLAAFLLCAAMGMMIGTSFGVTSTMGVILIAIARSGGVNELVVAGAVISGAFLGDRCSPASSCASLIAAITETKLYDNIRQLLKTGVLPMIVVIAAYSVLSVRNPISSINRQMLLAMEESFTLSPWLLVPPALMLVLPLCRLPVRAAMGASVAVSFLLTVFLQHVPAAEALRIAVLGYHPEGALAAVLSGGGLASMATAGVIVMVTSCYSGIIEGTDMLKNVTDLLAKLSGKIGVYLTLCLFSVLASMIFCNQTIVVMLDQQLMKKAYERAGGTKEQMAVDISNSGMMIAGWIPWSIAVGIPLGMLDVGAGAVPYAVLLYAMPVVYGLTRRLFYPAGKKTEAQT